MISLSGNFTILPRVEWQSNKNSEACFSDFLERCVSTCINTRFENPQNYNSLHLVKQKNYIIATEIGLADIENLLRTVPLVHEPDISFPQADRMSRIVNLIELLNEKPMSKQDITSEYAFDERQTNYYTDAGRTWDLLTRAVILMVLSFSNYLLLAVVLWSLNIRRGNLQSYPRS